MNADLILFNGQFHTVDRENPRATAVAIHQGRFVAVGTDGEAMALRGSGTQVIDLKGRTVIPGLNDSHLHLIRGGLNYNLELRWEGLPSLADALAASSSARSIVLLGDPLQLPQVSQASHPGGSGASVLEHVLGEHRTIPDDRGAFLSTTRRMHPDVSTFISEQIYEGRLHTHPSCAVQNTSLGTGLRWLRAEHVGRSTESPEESAMVVEAIRSIIGATFTDAKGKPHTMTGADVMVVAPYNDQVRRLRADLDANPATASVKVGTVDKFQGQEAPVVFFTMTASSSADVSRGNDFLFSGEWWITIFPGGMLVVIALSVNLLGDWLRDALNPRLR